MSDERRIPVAGLALAAALLAAGVSMAVVAARGPAPPSGLQDRVRAVAAGLRCPVCQDLSVADSPAPLAGQMRATIAQQLQAGHTPAQIRSEFVAAYGEWILLSPPKRGLNLIAWIAPFVLLLAGVMAAVVAVRRWTARASSGPGTEGTPDTLPPADRVLLATALRELPEDPG